MKYSASRLQFSPTQPRLQFSPTQPRLQFSPTQTCLQISFTQPRLQFLHTQPRLQFVYSTSFTISAYSTSFLVFTCSTSFIVRVLNLVYSSCTQPRLQFSLLILVFPSLEQRKSGAGGGAETAPFYKYWNGGGSGGQVNADSRPRRR